MKTLLTGVAALAVMAGMAVGGTAQASGPKKGAVTVTKSVHSVTTVKAVQTFHPVTTVHTVHPVTTIKTVHPVTTVKTIHPVTTLHTVRPVTFNNYHLTNGVRFSHGFYFRGTTFRQFNFRCWSPRYRCWMFYYPGTNCYYYWSGQNGCFYPMNYLPVVAPGGALPSGIDTLPSQLPPGQLPPDQLPPNGQQLPPNGDLPPDQGTPPLTGDTSGLPQ